MRELKLHPPIVGGCPMTRTELARRLKCHRAHLHRLEKGIGWTPERLALMARLYGETDAATRGLDFTRLLFPQPDPEPSPEEKQHELMAELDRQNAARAQRWRDRGDPDKLPQRPRWF